MTSSVQHVAFKCRDVSAQEQFYAKHFGFKRVRTFFKDAPGEFILIRSGATCLELFPSGPDTSPAAAEDDRIGFTHLAFEVHDIEAVVAGLQADGVATDEIKDCSKHCEGMSVCFFNDPDGNRIELMQGYRDESPAE